MIDYAKQENIPALKRLWITCFGDGKEYVDFLFESLLRPESVLIYSDGEGEAAAMLCMQPFALHSPAEEAQGAYIFGVATLPEQQGRGLGTALIKEAGGHLMEEGAALSALVPAGESLFDFYGKRGYETLFHINKAVLAAKEIRAARRECVLSPSRLEQLAGRRDEFYRDRSMFVRWNADYLRAIGAECALLGGEVLAISCAGEEGYAVCYRIADRVVVKELVLAEPLLGDVMAALHARYGAASYTVYHPADTTFSAANRVLPFAMVQWYDKKKRERFLSSRGKAAVIAHVLD